MPVLAIALTAFAAHPTPHGIEAYELVGHREDGLAERIVVRKGRWDETVSAGPGVVQRLVVTPGRVVRYGPFGDVNVADRGTVEAYRWRIAVLTGTLPPPSASETMRGPRGTPATYEHYHRPNGATVEVTRERGAITEASLDPVFAMRDFGRDRDGVITSWKTAAGDGFRGVRSAAPAADPEPSITELEDGDPTVASLDGMPIHVFIDTGFTGFAVSEELAERGTPSPAQVPVLGLAGAELTGLVRFGTFSQLGVTRIGQVALVAPVLPEGYDAIEGIGMFPGRALHLTADHGPRVDRRGCARGARFSGWLGVANAIVEISGGPLPFDGWGVFDSGELSGRPVQIAYPPLVAAAAMREHLANETYYGVGGRANARCTTHPVKFKIEGLGTMSHPICYVADPLVRSFGIHYTVAFNPVELLGGPVTIDVKRQLICRDR